MKRKSTSYSSCDSGGWMHVCDDLFLARFRGQPCSVCGATSSYYDGKQVRSAGHHILSKELHRFYRYDESNIIVLCCKHHLGAEMSPHSHDTAAQAAFYDWMRENQSDKYTLIQDRRFEKFNGQWRYRSQYEEIGGEIAGKEEGLPMKDWKPKNHAKNVILTIHRCGGVLTIAEREKLEKWV